MSANTKIIVLIAILLAVIIYGFYDKNRKRELYQNFRDNKPILCDDLIIQKNKGWRIHSNRFFTNGKVMKTVVFCESINE